MLKGSGTTAMAEVDRFGDSEAGGVGWIAYPDEAMERAGHALAVDGEVWVLDPVDASGLDDLLGEFGDVAGVLVLLNRHKRDAAAVATRHDVPVYIPDWMTGVVSKLDAPVERIGDALGDTGYELRRLVDTLGWQEAALYDGSTLYVPGALGTASFFLTGNERVGVNPALRLFPPTSLRRLDPDRLLVGHGTGLHEGVPAAIEDAVSNSRSRAPKLYVETLREFLS